MAGRKAVDDAAEREKVATITTTTTTTTNPNFFKHRNSHDEHVQVALFSE
jgi:hypothetical protein